MFNNILIVCVGNICRSHMAEYLLQHMINKHGIDGAAHRARQLDGDMVKQNDLILVMEHWQKKEIESLYPYARGRVHLLEKWTDTEISDPYKNPKDAFVRAFEKINKACDQWCNKLC